MLPESAWREQQNEPVMWRAGLSLFLSNGGTQGMEMEGPVRTARSTALTSISSICCQFASSLHSSRIDSSQHSQHDRPISLTDDSDFASSSINNIPLRYGAVGRELRALRKALSDQHKDFSLASVLDRSALCLTAASRLNISTYLRNLFLSQPTVSTHSRSIANTIFEST